MMASRIYRRLSSSSNFLNQSRTSFHQQRSLTSSHQKLPPLFSQIYSQNPNYPTRHNINPPDRSDYSQLGRSNLTPKSLTSLRTFQNPYRFLSTSNPNQKSETPSENHELKHQEITGPTEDLEMMLKTVYRLSMISAGFGLLNIGLGAWFSYNSPFFGVDIPVLLCFGIFLSLAYMARRALKAIKQGRLRLQVMTFKIMNKNLSNFFVRLIVVSYVPLAAAMAALVYAEGGFK